MSTADARGGSGTGYGLDYELGIDDLVAFARYHHAHSPWLRQRQRVLRYGISLAMLGVIAAVAFLLEAPPGLWAVGVAITVAYALLFPARYDLGLRQNVLRMQGEGKNQDVLGPHRVELGGEAISEITPLREVRTRWPAVERVVETGDHVFVYVTGATALVIPRRAFADREAVVEFVERARAKIGAAAE
jgi:predicted tellurium resistance membrane protein TerC